MAAETITSDETAERSMNKPLCAGLASDRGRFEVPNDLTSSGLNGQRQKTSDHYSRRLVKNPWIRSSDCQTEGV